MPDKTCETCKWWKSTSQSQSVCASDEAQSCTRYPPIWNGETGYMVWWPMTPGSLIACGEYKERNVPPKVRATYTFNEKGLSQPQENGDG